MLSIIFDIDDTLYHRQDPFTLAFDKLFPDLSVIDRSQLFKQFLKHGNALFEDSMTGRIPMDEMYIKRFQMALADFRISVTEQEALEFQSAYLWEQEHIKLHPAYIEMLDCCREHSVFLGIITNGPSKHQRLKYHALGLTGWIPEEAVIASGDVGISKPNAEIFRIAEKKWNLELSQAFYVGDSYEHDILSSKSVGWHTIWLDRSRQSLAEICSAADYITFSPEELCSCIEKIIQKQ